ncbi:MAG: hypothetical protein QOF51_1861 [Chloroflexota bacterium]|nr:hypothetical protein [Chloroflexota bacterium]
MAPRKGTALSPDPSPNFGEGSYSKVRYDSPRPSTGEGRGERAVPGGGLGLYPLMPRAAR